LMCISAYKRQSAGMHLSQASEGPLQVHPAPTIYSNEYRHCSGQCWSWNFRNLGLYCSFNISVASI